MLCVATESEAVCSFAVNTPPLLDTATGLPRSTPPSWNCTVPTGTPAGTVIVAVNVTCCPENDGFSEDPRAAWLAALLMVRVVPALLALEKFVSPA